MPRQPLTADDRRTLDQIADRACKVYGLTRPTSFMMRPAILAYVTATHTGPDGPLDLNRLLDAPAPTFSHDIAGIMSHVDPATGKCGNFFLPRCLDLGHRLDTALSRDRRTGLAAMAGLSELPEGQGGDQ